MRSLKAITLLALLLTAGVASATDKLIALTFDDGPRPYVLFGSKGEHRGPGLVSVLDSNGVKATFFVVGWRLTPKTWGERRAEENVGITCLDAAQQLVKHGFELEDHTYSHIELRSAERTRSRQSRARSRAICVLQTGLFLMMRATILSGRAISC